jgi:hypothetical protein
VIAFLYFQKIFKLNLVPHFSGFHNIFNRLARFNPKAARPRLLLFGSIWQSASYRVVGSEGRIGQPFFELDIEGGDHIAHDGVKAAKRDELDDAGIAMDFDEPLLHLRRD